MAFSHSRLALVAATVAVLVLSGTGVAAARDAAPAKPERQTAVVPREPVPAGFATWEALFAEQNRLNAVADQIARAGEAEAGFAGMVVDPQLREVRVYWHQAVPVKVQAAIDGGRTQAPVRVVPAAYPLRQLDEEATRWVESGQVVGAAPQIDGSGVRLSLETDADAGRLQRPAGTVAPTTVHHTGTPRAAYNRQDDVPAYYGGGRIDNYSGGSCTAGFAITDGSGHEGFLTASHCGELWDLFFDGGGTSSLDNYMGQMVAEVEHRDIAIIRANVYPRVFIGTHDTPYSYAISGATKTWPGNFVCSSGAASGFHCGIKAFLHGWQGYMDDGQYVKHLIVAEQVNHGCATAGGDSGGPLVAYDSNNKYRAHGTITGGSGPYVPCGPTSGQSTVYFPRVTDAVLEFHATLQTA